MKIGIDCRLWGETGVGRYIRNLVEQLLILDKKNDYTLFALSKDREEILKQVQSDKFKIIEADIRWHTLEEQIKFPQILNKKNLDLVHFPYYSIPIFYNRPFVVTIHDLILHHFPTGQASTLPGPIYNLKLLGYKFVIEQAAKKAKKILTVSQATKKEIMDHLEVDPSKVVVTYEGIDNALNSKLKTQNSKLQFKSQNYFLYVGNAYPHKNLERLLKALSVLISQYPIVSLVMVGKEDYFYKRLKKKVQDLKLSDKVIFLEEVSDEELASLYQNALALVVPSFMEGFGLPALEAMANNCLVLVSKIPALQEVCGDAAVYFDPLDPRDIAEKMRDVCFNDLPAISSRRRQVQAGLNHFSEKIKKGFERSKLFSWLKMAQQTLSVYEQSASNP